MFFTIFMGKINYPHLPLLLESMRWNSGVQFILINVIQPGSNEVIIAITVDYLIIIAITVVPKYSELCIFYIYVCIHIYYICVHIL